jgi:hypothetical protein
MNERIKELVEKSYIYDRQNDSSFFNKELFAELIVRECAKVILETPVKYTEIDIMHIIRDNVKEHFGVEE